MRIYVAYYRVSTDRQGKSGLGLEAQTEAVSTYLAGRGEIIAEFTEVESGKKKDRPQLAAALDLCRKKKAALVIAKLDRLARNVAFIANLMDSGADFVAVDMPEANRLTLHILAAVAEHEREMISKRTREALAAAKRRGKKLGNPRPQASLERGRATHQHQANERRAKVTPIITELHEQGLSLHATAREMNRRGILTTRGSQWDAKAISRIVKERQINSFKKGE
jgi:DNA invertase Pin-like site-specific DNA recombinase